MVGGSTPLWRTKTKRHCKEYLDNLKIKYAKDEEDNGEIDEEEFAPIKNPEGVYSPMSATKLYIKQNQK